jgi:arsenate reductase
MAEALARAVSPPAVEIFSAGSAPTALNPYAAAVMAEIGIDMSAHRSKSVDDVPKERIGTVITLCAEEVCPVFPGPVTKLHWPFEDPAAAVGTDDEVRAVFRRVRDQIRVAVDDFFGAQRPA